MAFFFVFCSSQPYCTWPGKQQKMLLKTARKLYKVQSSSALRGAMLPRPQPKGYTCDACTCWKKPTLMVTGINIYWLTQGHGDEDSSSSSSSSWMQVWLPTPGWLSALAQQSSMVCRHTLHSPPPCQPLAPLVTVQSRHSRCHTESVCEYMLCDAGWPLSHNKKIAN